MKKLLYTIIFAMSFVGFLAPNTSQAHIDESIKGGRRNTKTHTSESLHNRIPKCYEDHSQSESKEIVQKKWPDGSLMKCDSTTGEIIPQDKPCNIIDIQWLDKESYSNETGNQPIELQIQTQDCINKEITISIQEIDNGFLAIDDVVNRATKRTVTNDTIILEYKPGNEECEEDESPNCKYGVWIKTIEGNERACNRTSNGKCQNFRMKESDYLTFNCPKKSVEVKGRRGSDTEQTEIKTVCDKEFTIEGESGINPQQTQPAIPTYDRNSPCYEANLNNTGKEGYNPNCYEFLAPIPGLGDNGQGRAIKDLKNYKLGQYINTMFEVALGILMVLSVIMIVIAGVEYMTTEAVYSKGAAKKRITGAITGLVLALGIFLILKTINPELLNINFGENIKSVSITVEDASDLDSFTNQELRKAGYSSQYHKLITNRKKTTGIANEQERRKLIIETSKNSKITPLGDNITIKNGTPKYTNIKNSVLDESFKNKLLTLNSKLKEKGINIRLTEVFGPTFTGHRSKCHYVGTCVDLATIDKIYTKKIVSEIIRTAIGLNLVPQFETGNRSVDPYKYYLEDDIDRAYLILPKITGDHFSIYDAK